MEKIRITNRQYFALTAIFTCSTSIIYVASSLAFVAGQDAWITAAITPVIGMLFLWMYSYLGMLYPEKTLVEILLSELGKWIGGFITVGFIALCLVDVPQVIWYVGNFVKQTLPGTPIYVINTYTSIALIIAVLYGVEAIARSSELFIFIISAMIILTLVLVIPNIKIENIVPVLERGVSPVLKGSLLLISYTTWPLIVLNMIYPSHLDNIKRARHSRLMGYFWGSAIIFLVTIMAILVLGSEVTKITAFPTYLLAKEISAGLIITRMEAVVSIAWIIALFFKAMIYFYAGLLGVSQLLKLKDQKKIILPLGLLVLVLSAIVYPDSIYEANWDKTTWIPWIGTFSVILPVVLLIVNMIKRRGSGNRPK